MPNPFEDRRGGLESSSYRARPVTPSGDSRDLPFNSRAFYDGILGDLRLTTAGGDTVTFRSVLAGLVPVRAARVFAAADTVAIW